MLFPIKASIDIPLWNDDKLHFVEHTHCRLLTRKLHLDQNLAVAGWLWPPRTNPIPLLHLPHRSWLSKTEHVDSLASPDPDHWTEHSKIRASVQWWRIASYSWCQLSGLGALASLASSSAFLDLPGKRKDMENHPGRGDGWRVILDVPYIGWSMFASCQRGHGCLFQAWNQKTSPGFILKADEF